MRIFATAVTVAALLVSGQTTSAQTSDQAALERLVLQERIASGLKSDSVKRKAYYAGWAIDPDLEERTNELTWRASGHARRPPAESARLAALLGSGIVSVVPKECRETICRLGSQRGVLSFSPVTMRGDTAEIDLVSRHWRRPGGSDLLIERTRWTFVRDGSGWRKVRQETVIIS